MISIIQKFFFSLIFCSNAWMFLFAHQPENPLLLSRGYGQKNQTLNPQGIQCFSDRDVLTDLFEGLFVFKPGPRIAAGAAASWRVSEDRKTWTFEIKEHACWSDGSPLLAEDFVRHWLRLCDPDQIKPTVYARALNFLSSRVPILHGYEALIRESNLDEVGIKALGPKILELKLAVPVRQMLLFEYLTDPFFFPIKESYLIDIDQLKEDRTSDLQEVTVVTNGRYRLKGWQHASRILLEKNEDHWDAEATPSHGVDYRLGRNEESLKNEFMLGELDYFSCDGFQQDFSHLTGFMKSIRQAAFSTLSFNLRDPDLQKIGVRQAINLLIDRDFMFNNLEIEEDSWLYGFLNPKTTLDASLPGWHFWNRAQRLQKARELLAWEGYTAQAPLKLDILPQFESERMLQSLRAFFDEMESISYTISKCERSVVNARLKEHRFQIFLAGFVTLPSWDPIDRFGVHCHASVADEKSSLTGYDHPSYNRMLKTLRGEELSPYLKRALYAGLEHRIQFDLPSLPLLQKNAHLILSSRVEGFPDRPGYPAGTLPSSWLKLKLDPSV